MAKYMALLITFSIVSIFSTACNTTKLADSSKAIQSFQQLHAAQATKITEVAKQYQQQLSTCLDRVREPSIGNWNHMDIRLPTDKCPNESWINHLVINPKNPDTIYAAGTKVFKSTDAGESWAPINQMRSVRNEAIDDFKEIFCLAINPRATNEIYLMTSNYVFKSTDGGNVWGQLD